MPTNKKLIIGERYGYGFSNSGNDGYDYPTGGAGMIFSRSAAKQLAETCSCPTIDSPDDMIIAAFHQAQPMDYAELYLKRIQPISFHKFEELDPYEVYMKWLHEDMPKQAVHALHESSRHTEL
uniref:Fringe-like glycosyltransferase domain-containing protein n=1 Tax=Acrobeloides nanus TaxID=290746 RepID=A0A914CV13_9BILA